MPGWDWVEATLALKEDHADRWRDRSSAYWFWRLLSEFVELFLALLGLHKDKPEWEMMQIATICLNWLEYREESSESSLTTE